MTKLDSIYSESYDDPTAQMLVDLERERFREDESKRKNKEFVTYTDVQLDLISSVAGLKAKEVTRIVTELIESGSDVSALADAWMVLQGHKDYLYVHGFDAWYKWNGRAWESDYKRTIDRDITAYLRYVNRLFVRFKKSNNNAEYTKIVERWLYLTDVTPQKINSVKDVSSTLHSIGGGEFDTLNVLNFPNGTLNLDTFEFTAHSKTDYQTFCTNFAYDPAATCPLFEKFISEICVQDPGNVVDVMEWFTDHEMENLLQEFMGLCLTNDNSTDTSLLGRGDGANGKSTLIEVLAAVLGRLSMPFDFDSLEKNAEFALSTLPGKRLIFATESGNKQQLDTKYLNTIISGEPVKARGPYAKTHIDFSPQCKVFWMMNDLPKMSSTKQGAWRRLIIMPFFREFTADEKDPLLSKKLMAELPGILNWMVDGLKRLREQNNTFSECVTCKAAKDKYQGATNNIIGFVNQWLEPTSYSEGVSGAQLYDWYLTFVKATTSPMTFGKPKFGAFVKSLIKENKRTANGFTYAVKLNPLAIAAIKKALEENKVSLEFFNAVHAKGF